MSANLPKTTRLLRRILSDLYWRTCSYYDLQLYGWHMTIKQEMFVRFLMQNQLKNESHVHWLKPFATYNNSHKFWDQSPPPTINVGCKFWTNSWHKLQCCYSSNILQHWVWGRALIYFCNVDYSRISIYSSRNWLGLNNLCEIYCRYCKTKTYLIG